MKWRKRAESSVPAMPITRFFGKPEAFSATWHMASRGFVTITRIASGERFVASVTTPRTIPAFVLIRSSRLIPGLRAIPLVTTMMSEPFVSS